MSDAAPRKDDRPSLRGRQADLTRALIVQALHDLLRDDHPDAITYSQVAETAGVSLRTVYRYFPTRTDLLRSARQWFDEQTQSVRWDDPHTVTHLGEMLPDLGKLFDEHTNLFRALTTAGGVLPEPRRVASAEAVAAVASRLSAQEVKIATAVLSYIRSGYAWLVLHDDYGLCGDEIVEALDWVASLLIDDLQRRNEATPAGPIERQHRAS